MKKQGIKAIHPELYAECQKAAKADEKGRRKLRKKVVATLKGRVTPWKERAKVTKRIHQQEDYAAMQKLKPERINPLLAAAALDDGGGKRSTAKRKGPLGKEFGR